MMGDTATRGETKAAPRARRHPDEAARSANGRRGARACRRTCGGKAQGLSADGDRRHGREEGMRKTTRARRRLRRGGSAGATQCPVRLEQSSEWGNPLLRAGKAQPTDFRGSHKIVGQPIATRGDIQQRSMPRGLSAPTSSGRVGTWPQDTARVAGSVPVSVKVERKLRSGHFPRRPEVIWEKGFRGSRWPTRNGKR